MHLARHDDPWLSAGQLARFAGGLTWRQIIDDGGLHHRTWWTHAVAEAEFRGLLEWDHNRHVWGLTPKGRKHVRDIA